MALNKRKVLDTARKHAQKGAKAKALKEYNKLLSVDPHDAKLLLEVGDAYRRWGQPDEAIAQYSKVAGQYRQDGFDARAVAVFKQILNLDPKHYAAYVSLGELYQRMGLDSEAVASLQIAADGYHKEGKKPEALDLLRQMAALDPSNTTSRLKVAELLRQEGMEDDAIAEYQAVASELQGQQDRDQLIVVYDRVLEIRPNHLETLSAQVRNLMSSGALDRAEPLAVRALNVSDEVGQYDLLVDLYAQMGNDAKLADATRGLAKLYRERGDEDKARELMQRLPAEDVVAPDARLAVDLSECEEPMLEDEELLDEPFLAADDGFDMMTAGSASESMSAATPIVDENDGELGIDGISSQASEPTPNEDSSAGPLPLPEGDPDQLLAEASVYLRYGKSEQAIASLRGVIAQVPTHRAALEKLGEAYAESGQNSDAASTWVEAAEQVRLDGDAAALEILRDRIAALDPGLAEQVGQVDNAATSSREASAEAKDDVKQTDSFAVELELDVEVDLGLDDAIEEIAASDGEGGFDFDASESSSAGISASSAGGESRSSVDHEFEIDLNEESQGFDQPPVIDAEVSSTAIADAVLELDDELSLDDVVDDEALGEFINDENENSIEFEIDTNGLSVDEFIDDLEGESSGPVEIELDAAKDTAVADEDAESTPAIANVEDDLEEAGFYIAQDMFDEAEAIVGRVLEGAPSHAQALVLMGEIAAARAGSSAATPPSPGLAGEVTQPEAGLSLGPEESDDDSAEGDKTLDSLVDEDDDVSFEVELDMDLEDDDEDTSDGEGLFAESGDDLTSRGDAVELDVDEAVAAAAAVEATEGEEPGGDEAIEEAAAEAGETFDLREALADVIEEDAATPAPDTSGVLSTVEDGFESIFSDFKKGVTATLDNGDYDTRYDLGIAYREMGLFDDAIGEFRVCLDSPNRRFDSLYLMGLCARDLMRWDDSVNHLEQALALPEIPEERLAGVYFDLSIAHEGAGDMTRASASVQRVIELEADFPGAAARLATLESGGSALPEVGVPGEGYETFDDLFEDDEGDASGDAEIAESAPAEAFESFDDLVSEAEAALDEADAAEASEQETTSPGDTKKTGRKKISFV